MLLVKYLKFAPSLIFLTFAPWNILSPIVVTFSPKVISSIVAVTKYQLGIAVIQSAKTILAIFALPKNPLARGTDVSALPKVTSCIVLSANGP